jgi:hypothetical protein
MQLSGCGAVRTATPRSTSPSRPMPSPLAPCRCCAASWLPARTSALATRSWRAPGPCHRTAQRRVAALGGAARGHGPSAGGRAQARGGDGAADGACTAVVARCAAAAQLAPRLQPASTPAARAFDLRDCLAVRRVLVRARVRVGLRGRARTCCLRGAAPPCARLPPRPRDSPAALLPALSTCATCAQVGVSAPLTVRMRADVHVRVRVAPPLSGALAAAGAALDWQVRARGRRARRCCCRQAGAAASCADAATGVARRDQRVAGALRRALCLVTAVARRR